MIAEDPGSLTDIPKPAFCEMKFCVSAAWLMPIVLPLAPDRTDTPWRALPKKLIPLLGKPIKLPRIWLPVVDEPVRDTPSRKLPEMVLRSLDEVPPTILFLAPAEILIPSRFP